jgi:hypothetical protein
VVVAVVVVYYQLPENSQLFGPSSPALTDLLTEEGVRREKTAVLEAVVEVEAEAEALAELEASLIGSCCRLLGHQRACWGSLAPS